jgi:hypothetical protein
MNGKDATAVVEEAKKEEAEAAQQPDPAQIERSKITIVLTADGNIRVDGPLSDQPLYFYMLRIAGKIGDEYADRMRRRQQQAAEAEKNKPFWRRKIEEAARKKAEEKALAEAAQAEVAKH